MKRDDDRLAKVQISKIRYTFLTLEKLLKFFGEFLFNCV